MKSGPSVRVSFRFRCQAGQHFISFPSSPPHHPPGATPRIREVLEPPQVTLPTADPKCNGLSDAKTHAFIVCYFLTQPEYKLPEHNHSQLGALACVRGMGTVLLNYFATTLALQPLSKSFDLSAFIS